MPDLLIELFSEEIPARMQKRAAEDLKRMVSGTFSRAQATATAGLIGFALLPAIRRQAPVAN